MQQTQSTATDTAEIAIVLAQNLPKVNDKKQEATHSKDNVAEESKSLTGRYPKDFRERRKEERKKADRKAKKMQRLASRTAKEVEWVTSSEHEADDTPTFAVKYRTQEQEPSQKITLRSDGKDKPPISTKRQFSLGRLDNYYQIHESVSGRKPFSSRFQAQKPAAAPSVSIFPANNHGET